jgi:hypothetical protein
MKRSYWIEIISSLFILLFVYTAVSKLIDFKHFRYTLNSAPLLKGKGNFLAWLIPISEIAVSILLFFPKTRKPGFWGSLLLMLCFTGYLTYMLFFSEVRPCSCGGVIEKMTWTQHFIFNIIFTLLAGLGLWIFDKKDRKFEKSLQYSTSAQ